MNEIYPPDFFKAFRYSNGSVNPPSFRASYKQTPEDFIVTEELGFDLSGDEQGEQQSNIEGEHFWVFVEKTQRHTTDVAKQLAKQVKIPAKDVGISGMKDHQAVTRQWFSLWKPQAATAAELDFSELDDPTIKILHQAKHIKKLKRGVHKANHFELILRQAKGSSDILAANIERVQRDGVPNYFGEQRFGFKGSNLHKAHEWFTKGYSIKQRNKRSLLLSSARSYLFNQMLSERIKQGDWLTPYIGERLNLDGSKSTYLCEDIVTDQQRIDEGDVHTSSVLWGENDGSSLSDIERQVSESYPTFCNGLESARMELDRRALRFIPTAIDYEIQYDEIKLNFSLQKGQYATMLLRELINASVEAPVKASGEA